MKRAKIYQPTKTAMQSGNRNTKNWLLEFDTLNTGINPLMGWETSNDTMSEVKLEFSTKEQAINFAKKNDIMYYIVEPQKRKIIKKSYSDNFLKNDLMIKSFLLSMRWRLWAWGGFVFIIGSLLAQTWIDVKINQWYKSFYDLLQEAAERDVSEFYDGLYLFMKLAIPYVIIYTITNYFTRLYAFRWREAMTFAYMPYWKKVDAKVEGASQRIQEDCMNFAKIVESIGLQIVRAIMLLIAFIPILWGLSSNVIIPWLSDITGSLVYVSLTASLGGLLISWFVGIKLPGLEYNNQVVEAAFRKELVYGEYDRVEYAKPATILELFAGIKFNYHRLFLHYGYFDLWVIMYNQTMIIVPYIVMGQGLFTVAMTLGILIQTSSAFREVQSSFSLFMQNWTRITELRSIYRRLTEFEKAIGYKDPNKPLPVIERS